MADDGQFPTGKERDEAVNYVVRLILDTLRLDGRTPGTDWTYTIKMMVEAPYLLDRLGLDSRSGEYDKWTEAELEWAEGILKAAVKRLPGAAVSYPFEGESQKVHLIGIAEGLQIAQNLALRKATEKFREKEDEAAVALRAMSDDLMEEVEKRNAKIEAEHT